MNDFSDVFILMIAMTLFSSFSLSTARNFNISSNELARHDAEYRTIVTAQNELDYIKWIDHPSKLDPNSSNYIFQSHPESRTNYFGNSNQYQESIVVEAESYLLDETNSQARYKVIFTVSNQEFIPPITSTVSSIKSFAK